MKKINLILSLLLISSIAFAQTTYFVETFEDNTANGWILEEEWTVGNLATLYGLAGGNFNDSQILGFDDYAAGNEHVGGGIAITPLVDLTSATAPLFLEVLVKFRNVDQFGLDEQFRISVSTDNGSSWELFEEVSEIDWEKQIFEFDQFIGESVLIAFEYTDGGGYNIGAAIDDIAISNELVFTQELDYTLTVDGGAMFSECAENIDYEVTGVVLNNGLANITSFDLLVESANGSNVFSFQTDINTNDVFRYSIPETLNTGTSPSNHTISIINVNGSTNPDIDETDNAWEIVFAPVSTLEGKGVLLEEGTGMWCGVCPRGTVFIEEISKRFGSQVATVAVHNNDPLVLSEYDEAIQDAGIFGYPSVVFNRADILDPDAIVMPVIEELTTPAIADINVAANQNINDFTPTIKVTFNQAISNSDYNVSVILTEDNLSNNSESWNQSNGYSQSEEHMGGFEFFSTDVPSSFSPYNHVGRALIGTFEGENIIEGDFDSGATITHTFEEFTLPLGWDKVKLKVIAVLTDENGEVINAIIKKYNDALSTDISTNTQDFVNETMINIYPNPTNDRVTVDLMIQNASAGQIKLINLVGQTLLTQKLEAIEGRQEIVLNLNSINEGVYILQIEFNSTTVNKKITVQR